MIDIGIGQSLYGRFDASSSQCWGKSLKTVLLHFFASVLPLISIYYFFN